MKNSANTLLLFLGILCLAWDANGPGEPVSYYAIWKLPITVATMDTLRTEEREGVLYYYLETDNPPGAQLVKDNIPQLTGDFSEGDPVDACIDDVSRSDLETAGFFVKAYDSQGNSSGPSNIVHCGKDQSCIDNHLLPGQVTGIRKVTGIHLEPDPPERGR